MPDIVSNCPLCGSDSWSTFDQREFRGFRVVNVLCSHCGLVFQSPRMTSQELEAFYQNEYREIYQGTDSPTEKDLKIQEARAGNLVDLLKAMGIEHVARYLDIGSSSGLLMKAVQETFNCQVSGIEPGVAYREYARGLGLTVYEDIDKLKSADHQKFDLVSLIHVLEHIPDPVGYLAVLREKLLLDDARLLIEVPNLYAHDCFEVAHLTSFSQETLTQVLKKAGFQPLFFERHGSPRSKLIPLYIAVLAEPFLESLTPGKIDSESLVRVKRRAGFLHRRVIERILPSYGWVPEYRAYQ